MTIEDRLASFADEIEWLERHAPSYKPGHSRARRFGGTGSGARGPHAGGSPEGPRARAVREHVRHLVHRTPQVIVKISGGAIDLKHASEHLRYIQQAHRRLDEEDRQVVENEVGDRFVGRSGRALALRQFGLGGYPIPAEVELTPGQQCVAHLDARQETINVVFSMPYAVQRQAVAAAARATCRQVFAGHQWLIADHDNTDNPHAHVLVKLTCADGIRRRPDWRDFEHWRSVFAGELQARGVPAVATRRRLRQQAPRSAWLPPAPEAQSRAERVYLGVHQALSASSSSEDRELARLLSQHLRNLGISTWLATQLGRSTKRSGPSI